MSEFTSFLISNRFKDFSNSVQFCTLCPRMNHRKKVLSDLNGKLDSKVLFIAEAPGRLGADKTGIPLYGDKSGTNFDELLTYIGWSRDDIFITNALLCNPRQENGTNSTPNVQEIRNCSIYLMMTIKLINPEYIVTLGKVALDALGTIKRHTINLKDNVGEEIDWNGYKIVPLYHTGPRAMIHRNMAIQKNDFVKLSKRINLTRGTQNITRYHKKVQQEIGFSIEYSLVESLIFFMLNKLGELSLFKLNKLLYLADYNSIKHLGSTLSGLVYLRQKDGPWIPTLWKHLQRLDKSEIEIIYKGSIPMIRIIRKPAFSLKLPKEKQDILNRVTNKYGKLSNSRIKSIVYLTPPMRHVIMEEKQGKNLMNSTIIYKDMTILDLN